MYKRYAKLGCACDTSMAVLVSNTKFIPPNDLIYLPEITKMKRYPSTKPYLEEKDGKPYIPSYTPNETVPKGCCGQKISY